MNYIILTHTERRFYDRTTLFDEPFKDFVVV